MKLRILCVAGSTTVGRRLERLLAAPDRILSIEKPSVELWSGLGREPLDAVFAMQDDLPVPAEPFLRSIRELPGHPDLFLLTASDDLEDHARWVARGASRVVYTRLSDRLLRGQLDGWLDETKEKSLPTGVTTLAEVRADLDDFVSRSLAMQELLMMARRLAESDTSILIFGETGVGKEWLARAIHERSPRSRGRFVALNCAAVPEALLESELFGHVEGAFTGAVRSRRGRFELAHEGTLFLDEIAEMPAPLQAKLLRVLQDGEVTPLGSEAPISVDARIMAATNRDLETVIGDGSLRRDLFYRIGVVTLTVPGLRERKEDIPALVENYLERFAVELQRPIERVSPDALRRLIDYDWPGNVRELINVMERAVLLCEADEISPAHLPATISGGGTLGGREPGHRPSRSTRDVRPLVQVRKEAVERLEREYLERLLLDREGRVGEVARLAGLDPRTLYTKMRRYGLRKEDFRPDLIGSG